MSDIKKMSDLLKEVKSSKFVFSCSMPLGYTYGYPIITVRNGQVLAVIPFLKYKSTGVVDKTLVYPIRYTVTYSYEKKSIVGFEDLQANMFFSKLEFNKPIGYFRHDAIKHLLRADYMDKQQELYKKYDAYVSALLYKEPYSGKDLESFRELLSMMLEPSLKPMYKALSPGFAKICIR